MITYVTYRPTVTYRSLQDSWVIYRNATDLLQESMGSTRLQLPTGFVGKSQSLLMRVENDSVS